MTIGEKGLAVATVAKSVFDISYQVSKAVDYGSQYYDMATNVAQVGNVTASTVTQILGSVASGLTIAIGGYNTISAQSNMDHCQNASEILERKRRRIEAEHSGDNSELSEEELAKQKKEKRELKYENCMLNLSKMLADRKETAGAFRMNSGGFGILSITLPGVGVIIGTCVGVGLGIAGSIYDVLKMGNIKDKLFENYFDFENFYQKVLKKAQEKNVTYFDKDRLRVNLKKRLAAAAGFADMNSACNFIASKFADLIRSKLFGDKKLNPNGTQNEKEELNGYIQLVKSFGLKYDPESGQPDKTILTRKLTGR